MLSGRKDAPKKGVRSRTIFRRILRPLSLLAVLDAFLLVLVLEATGVLHRLNQNSFDILENQVVNRQSYLQAQMAGHWMQLEELAAHINSRTEAMLRSGALNLERLDSSGTECTPLILDVVDALISQLYAKQVSGIFLTFNTHDLSADAAAGAYQEKTGIYIRDNDPLAVASEKNTDLLLVCAPVQVVRSLALSTDSSWEQRFKFGPDRPYEPWLVEPYTVAASSAGKLAPSDCGLWSLRLDDQGNHALTYSIPLVLSNRQVYGVLGIDLLPTYLSSQMPTAELGEGGVYGFLMSMEETPDGGTVCAIHDKSGAFRLGETVQLTQGRYGGYVTTRGETEYTVSLTPLSLYSRNAPFEQQRWYVMGAVPTENLYAFSSQVRAILTVTVLLMLAFGITGALAASWHIARPISGLRRELKAAWDRGIPRLSPTGISEVDDFAQEITSLSRDVVRSSRRFLSIMEMSSIDMGGYELDDERGFLFVTDNFFRLLGLEDVTIQGMTPAQFRFQMNRLEQSVHIDQEESGGRLYTIPTPGSPRYIHVQQTLVDSRLVGVAEDVTVQVCERMRIEHERDYDLLTDIYNRRAFFARGEALLRDQQRLGTAVAVMIDLDNLKKINDTYGHEWGDRYIVAGTQCIRSHVPEKSLVSRASGDEFNLLLYGFRDRQEARAAVARLEQGFRESRFLLPDGQVRPIGASGGAAFVGEDSWELKQLIKYADFAMYIVKHGTKGHFGEFDREVYRNSEAVQAKRQAFQRVLQEHLIRYVFQPIFDARTGALFGCEALLRVLDDRIASTEEFLRIARKEDALGEIEHLTWNDALSGFRSLIEQGTVGPQTKVFINSQVSRLLNAEEQQRLIERFGDIRDNTVLEVVETDDPAPALPQLRSGSAELFAQEFSLDDFGTGYNSDKNLLELMPRYVKLDIALVREVEKHPDRQQLLAGLISFAHEKGMLVLAEGVETTQELQCLLEMGVDMLQGYLLARPAPIPGPINPQALTLIRQFSKEE